jgi:ribonuclease HI
MRFITERHDRVVDPSKFSQIGNGKVYRVAPDVLCATYWGAEKVTTNNICELKSVLVGVSSDFYKQVIKDMDIKDMTIVTDSKYVVNIFNEYIHGWRANGWRTSQRKPVKNKELICKVSDAIAGMGHTHFMHTYGHSGNYFNELCDALANYALGEL